VVLKEEETSVKNMGAKSTSSLFTLGLFCALRFEFFDNYVLYFGNIFENLTNPNIISLNTMLSEFQKSDKITNNFGLESLIISLKLYILKSCNL
jgi:hypothetical protein